MSNPATIIFLSNFTTTSKALGVTLPGEVVSCFSAVPPLPPFRSEAQAVAAQAIAETATMTPGKAEKTVREALDTLARSEAIAPIRGRISDTLDEIKVQTVRAHGPAILAAFALVLAPDFEALNTYAPRIPANLDPAAPADRMTPAVYEATHHSRRAAARIEQAVAGLGFLARVPGDRGTLHVNQYARLAVLDLEAVPENGRVAVVRALRDQNPTRADGIRADPAHWFAVAAGAGATFTLTDTDARRANAERVESWRVVTSSETGGLVRL